MEPLQETPPPHLWRNSTYLAWLTSDTSSALGAALQSFAIPLLALFVTGSPAQAGVIAAIGQIGRILTTIPGGVLADRHDRRRLMIIGGLTGAVIGTALTGFQLAGMLGFWSLTALHLLMCLRNGLFGSVSNAALKSVVDERSLGSALAANQGRDAVISLSGGPVGGLLFAISRAAPLAAISGSHLLAAISARLIHADLRPSAEASPDGESGEPRAAADGRKRGVVRDFLHEAREGFGWLLHRPELRGVLFISTILNLGVNAAVTSVVFGLQQRGEAPVTIGWVSAALGVGMLGGSILAPTLIKRFPTGPLICAGLILISAAIATLPFVTHVWAIAVVLAAGILGAPAINAGLGGYFMAAVPTHLLGRANSAADLLSMGAVPLAPLIAGFGYLAWGWQGLLLLCAGIVTVATALALTNRQLRSLPGPTGWADRAAREATRSAAPAQRANQP
ncbi:MFS transporter [Paeniglutamicibacter cryotolerans]|uniref:MFS family permease n=1 Tax=Paeniglutamicibacter cryotolerans TaxID=670079 RepID=A0A839QSX1_9MICC|nr:MFS transporter [Paeniglutamicibacter cryotolerans]MBB2995141.1 MFS family permease [Paeniglutamicibacter cryotolerans]